MADDRTTQCLLFEGFERRPVVAAFDQERAARMAVESSWRSRIGDLG
jgi:hypothetical protein